MIRRQQLGAATLLILSLGAAARGAWIPAKAALAQLLLERSFSAAQAAAAQAAATPPQPPWPWADVAPLARLSIDHLDVERLVLDSATGAALAFGPGHLAGTPRPGSEGNTVIAGHRDTHFAFLADLQVGDGIEIESPTGDRRAYEVEWTKVVAADETWVASPTLGDALTLITCYPFGDIASHADERYVVRAGRTRSPARSAQAM